MDIVAVVVPFTDTQPEADGRTRPALRTNPHGGGVGAADRVKTINFILPGESENGVADAFCGGGRAKCTLVLCVHIDR